MMLHGNTKVTARACWGGALAGIIFILLALAGPDTFRHPRVSGRDFHNCPLCQWVHGASTSATPWIALTTPLPTSRLIDPRPLVAAPDAPTYTSPSRAPPAIA
jgi:hypothetical protein